MWDSEKIIMKAFRSRRLKRVFERNGIEVNQVYPGQLSHKFLPAAFAYKICLTISVAIFSHTVPTEPEYYESKIFVSKNYCKDSKKVLRITSAIHEEVLKAAKEEGVILQ